MTETTQSMFNLEKVFMQNGANEAEDMGAYFDEKKLSLKKYLGSTGLQYNIVQYQKDWIDDSNVNTIGLCRSVIFDNEFNMLCFSPPKSIKLDIAVLENEKCDVSEFMEGTMINMFYDKRLDNWEIATRSTIGANVKFYRHSPTTFNSMFYETFRATGLNESDLKKDHCYSFILQHVGNRIVVPFTENRIYLSDSYKIGGGMNVVSSYDDDLVHKFDSLKIPRIELDNFGDIVDQYAKSGETSFDVMGVVFKNSQTGQRMKLRNPEYEVVRKLRGNQCKDQYNYLVLRGGGNVSIYLQHYPEDKKRFSMYRDLIHKATRDLYTMYQECYIYKKAELKTFPKEFKTNMYKLHHEVYLMKLKPDKLSMQLSVVKEYVNELHPSLLMSMTNRNAAHVMMG